MTRINPDVPRRSYRSLYYDAHRPYQPLPLTVRKRQRKRTQRQTKVRPPTPDGERAFVCGNARCRRFTYLSWEESHDWLISYRKRARTTAKNLDSYDPHHIIVRCPQHITQWALREAGAKYNRNAMARVRRNKNRDQVLYQPGDLRLDPFTTTPVQAAPWLGRGRAGRGST
jgi:hypothetical protein